MPKSETDAWGVMNDRELADLRRWEGTRDINVEERDAEIAKLRAEIRGLRDRTSAKRVEALERALADQVGRCSGCGGSGYEPDTTAACRGCRKARAILDEEGGQGDG